MFSAFHLLSLALEWRSALVRLPLSVQQQPAAPIIVKIVEPPHDPTGIADVLVGALGVASTLNAGADQIGDSDGATVVVAMLELLAGFGSPAAPVRCRRRVSFQ